MCGIFGATSPDKIEPVRFAHALTKLDHRGPDHKGQFQNEHVFLGHTRLSILDLSAAAHQPMQDNKSWIVFNGEIYNHFELRKKFLQDQTCNSHSDTETLIKAYNQVGMEFIPHIEGMYAFAIYDSQKQTVTLARDPLGIKPLYYVLANDQLIFSSEIKAILEVQPIHTAQLQTLQTYLTYENYPNPETCFHKIQMLQPGEILTCDLPTKKIQRYVYKPDWNLKNQLSEAEWIEQGASVIEKSVKNHLLSDVPVGVFMSGGIDSSLVATMAARHSTTLKAFTGYFKTDDEHYDERPYTCQVAKAANIDLQEIEIRPEDFTQYFDSIVWHLDEPKMGMGSFSQYVVAKKAAKERKVMLAGHGGDELFAGYPLFKAAWYKQKGLPATMAALARGEFSQKELPWMAYTLLRSIGGRHFPFAPEIFNDLNISPNISFTAFQASSKNQQLILDELDHYYRELYLNGLLVVEDKISMAHSLESRVPLWSKSVLEFAYSIPVENKVKHGTTKYLLKKIAQKYLPASVIHAPKRGFPTPLRLWFRKELKSFCEERLLSANPLLDQIVRLEKRQEILHRHFTRRSPFAIDERRAHKIFMLLSLESWFRQFQIKELQ